MNTPNLTKNTNLLFGEVCIGCKNFDGSICSKGHEISLKNTPIKDNTPVTNSTGCYEAGKGLF